MNGVLDFDSLGMTTANQNASDVDDTNTNGNKQLSSISDILGQNWNDQNGQNTLINLGNFQHAKKTTDNLFFDYKKVLENSAAKASKTGNTIKINGTVIKNEIEKSSSAVSTPIQNAIGLLNQAAGLAPKFAGDINAAASSLKTATTSVTIMKNKTLTMLNEVAVVEDELSKDLDTLIDNNSKESLDMRIQEQKQKGYLPSSAKIEIEKARRAGRQAPLAGMTYYPDDKAKDIIDYAKRFLGHPYVWGEENLDKGADCSGYVKAVFALQGIDLPRYSQDMANSGTEVKSLEQAKPGDIIVYTPKKGRGDKTAIGHVAIYMGDNKIIHAAGKNKGIIISDNAAYREIKAIRRVLQ